MSLALTTSQTSLVGNGVNTAFPTGFTFENESDLVVELDTGAGFVTQILGLQYDVTGAGDEEPGGEVNFTAAPANGDVVRITRATPRTQPIDLESQFELLPEVIEGGFDRVERQLQELERRLAAVEVPAAAVTLNGQTVTDGPFNCADPYAPRNVACVGTPAGVFLARVQDHTDGTLVHYGLGAVDWVSPVLNQFTSRYVPGLTPGHSYTLTYLVLA